MGWGQWLGKLGSSTSDLSQTDAIEATSDRIERRYHEEIDNR